MNLRKQVLIEGWTVDEILEIPDDQMDTFVFQDEPMLLRIGSGQILGQFRLTDTTLTLELAEVAGGGEGVLPTLWLLAERYAHKRRLTEIEWIVHSLHCAHPNLKLRRVMERKGFRVEEVTGIGLAYHLVTSVSQRDTMWAKPQ